MLPAMRRIIASALPSAVLVPALLLQAATGLPARAADGFIGAELALALPEDGCQEWGIIGYGWTWGPYWGALGGAAGAVLPAANDGTGPGPATGPETGLGAENTEGGADGFTTSAMVAPQALLPCGVAALGGVPVGGSPAGIEMPGWTPFGGAALSGPDGEVDAAMTGSVVWLGAAPPAVPFQVWPGSLPGGGTPDRAQADPPAGDPPAGDPPAGDPDNDPGRDPDPDLTLVVGPPTPVPGIVAAVMPEPRTMLLLGLALAALALFRHRRA